MYRVLSRALSTYFTQVSRLFVKDWRRGKKGFIFTNNGINVMLRIYEQGIVYLRHTPKASEIRRLLQPLKRHYQSNTRQSTRSTKLRSACNGEGGRATTAFELMSAIQGSFPGYAASAVTRSSPRDVIADFESKVRTAVVEHMQRKDPNWWIDPARMPPHLRTRAEGRSLAVPGIPPRYVLKPWRDRRDRSPSRELERHLSAAASTIIQEPNPIFSSLPRDS